MQPRSDTGFPCTACGACCRIAGLWGHPSLDGRVCIFLDERTNLCTVYDSRPEVCRFGTKKPSNQTVGEYAADVAAGCNMLQEQMGMDPAYRVILRGIPLRPARST